MSSLYSSSLSLYLLAILGHTLYIVGFIYANQQGFHPIQTNLVRGLTAFFVNFAVLFYKHKDMNIRSIINYKMVMTRTVAVFVHSNAIAASQLCLPQPIVHTINSTGPVFVMIENYFLNGIKINSFQFKGIALTMLGVLLTVNGSQISTKLFGGSALSETKSLTESSTFQNYIPLTEFQRIIVIIMLTLIVAFWGLGQIAIKQTNGVDPYQINFNLGTFLTCGSGLLYPLILVSSQPQPFGNMCMGMLLIGMPMAVGNIFTIYVYAHVTNVGLATLCICSSVVFGYGMSVFRYHQAINWICLGGSLFIVAGLGIALVGQSSCRQSEIQTLLAKQEITLEQYNQKKNQLAAQDSGNSLFIHRQSSSKEQQRVVSTRKPSLIEELSSIQRYSCLSNGQ